MVMIITDQGRQIEIIFQSELCDPLNMGEYVRAYCHLHGSDHQRSLSIHKLTGWGHCFNATCDATVLVAEWNPAVAERLLHASYRGAMPLTPSSYPSEQQHPPYVSPSVLLHPTRTPPTWQQDELTTLRAWDEQMRLALLHAQGTWTYLEERGIPLQVAQATGVGYLSPAMLTRPVTRQQRSIGRRWAERIVFPLASPAGKGYIGRSLWRWRPGMDEHAHKALDQDQPGGLVLC